MPDGSLLFNQMPVQRHKRAYVLSLNYKHDYGQNACGKQTHNIKMFKFILNTVTSSFLKQ